MVTPRDRQARTGLVILLVLSFLFSGFNLIWTAHEVNANNAIHAQQQAQQQRAGVLVEAKLCDTLRGLASLKPPPGNPYTNPSRGYLQHEHAELAQLGTDIGCKP